MPHPGPQYGPHAGGAIQTFTKGDGTPTTTSAVAPGVPATAPACAACAAASSPDFRRASSMPYGSEDTSGGGGGGVTVVVPLVPPGPTAPAMAEVAPAT